MGAMINFLFLVIILFIIGVFGCSAYKYFNEEKCKANKRKCRLNKYNK